MGEEKLAVDLSLPWQIVCGDVLDVLARLPAGSVHCAVTSPPYFALRDYQSGRWEGGEPNHEHDTTAARGGRGGSGSPGKQTDGSFPSEFPAKSCSCGAVFVDKQIGLEPTPEEYVATMVSVFAELRRVLRDDGVFFLNIGDSYWGSWGNYSGEKRGTGKQRGIVAGSLPSKAWDGRESQRPPTSQKHNELKPLDLCGIPHRVAFALQADGWYWRATYIWAKKAPMPISVNGWRWERCKVKVGKSQQKENPEQVCRNGRKEDVAGRGGPATGSCSGGESKAKWQDCPGCSKCHANGGFILRKGAWRPTTAHEYVFMFSKTARYYCDADAVKTEAAPATKSRDKYSRVQDKPDEQYAAKHDHETVCEAGANQRDVLWLGPEPLSIGLCKTCRAYYPNLNKIKQRVTPGKPKKPVCPRCGSTDFVSHYAAFPTRLIEPLIKAATPEAGVCGKCGSPWSRCVEAEKGESPTSKGSTFTDGKTGVNGQGRVSDCDRTIAVATLGWRPTCGCGTESVSALVLDPFSGSGTTVLVAKRLGRRSLGIDLSADYCEMARNRVSLDTGKKVAAKKKPVKKPIVVPNDDLWASFQ